MKNMSVFSICTIIIFAIPSYSQLAFDTLIFSIPLINDASKESLFNINKVKRVSDALSGPVVMKDNNLLFYSNNGYVLYNQKGRIIDSYSVFKKNKGLSENNPARIKLGFPIDNSTIMFYDNSPHGIHSMTLYEKEPLKRVLTPVKESGYKFFKGAGNKQIYNLAFHTTTDYMQETYCALPRLVGFTSMASGDKWWSADNIYSFSSPIIHEENGIYKSFFPGMKLEIDRTRMQTLEPLQIFSRDSKWFYTSVSVQGGNKSGEKFQSFLVFDQAGNILYIDTLLQVENMDEIIGEDEDTYYTVKKVMRNVFKPSVNIKGNVFYGIIDYKKKRIEIRKKEYYVYKSFPCKPQLIDLINDEKCVEFVPGEIDCNLKSEESYTIPKVTLLDSKSKKYIQADESHLKKDGYLCYINRIPNPDIKKKLARGLGGFPETIRGIVNTLSNEPTLSCPYGIIIKVPWMLIRSFSYPAGDEVLCARVLALRKNNELLIRVDCKNYAEVLIFKTDGTFLNRFVFNRQNYEKRLDLIVASKNSPIIELDYESKPENQTYLQWVRRLND